MSYPSSEEHVDCILTNINRIIQHLLHRKDPPKLVKETEPAFYPHCLFGKVLKPALKSYLDHSKSIKGKFVFHIGDLNVINKLFPAIFSDQYWYENHEINSDPGRGPLLGGLLHIDIGNESLLTIIYHEEKQTISFGFFLQKFVYSFDDETRSVILKQTLC